MSSEAYQRPTTPSVSERLDRLPVSHWHYKLVVLVGLAAFFDLYELYMSGVLGAVLAKPWHLGTISKPLLVGAPYFGMIIGAIALGALCDRFGRKAMFMCNLGAYSLVSGLSAFSPNIASLITCRVLCGVFMGAELILIDTYLTEFLPAAHRGRLIAYAYTIGFLGSPVAAGLGGLLVVKTNFLMAGWRWMLLAGAVGAMCVFVARRNLPESARWLAEKGRTAEAEAVVTRIEQDVKQQFGELPPVEPIPSASLVSTVSFADMFRPPYRRRTIMMWIFQITQTVGQFGFASLATLILVAKGYSITSSLLYTTLGFIGAPIGAYLAVFLVERVERKYLIVLASAAIAIAGIIFGNSSVAWVIVIAGFTITVCNSIVSSAWHVYQAELFPTRVRSTAGGVAYAFSRLTAGLLPFAALAILRTLGATQVFVFAAAIIAIMCISVAAMGPRTNRRSVEDLALSSSSR